MSNHAERLGLDAGMAACILFLARPTGVFWDGQILHPNGGGWTIGRSEEQSQLMSLVQEAFLPGHRPFLVLSWFRRHTFARISEKEKFGFLIKERKPIIIASSMYADAYLRLHLPKTTNTHFLFPNPFPFATTLQF